MTKITIPYNFEPRAYQIPLFNCLADGKKRGIAVWHRRAGKDKTFINILAKEAFARVGTYFYILPYYTQARKIIWEGMDKYGFRFIDHFPPQLVKRRDNQQMVLELVNGSIVRLLGSDDIDSIVGTNPVGVIFSEFSLHKVAAWNYLRPILLENDGWALFNGTPRGKNHLWDLLCKAKEDPAWFVSVKTIDDTGIMSPSQVEEEIANGMPRELAQQEFWCSFDAALVGAYYSAEMNRAVTEGRVSNTPWDSQYPVHTGWDLGIDDMTVIWFIQQVGKELRVIDLIADNGRGLDSYIKQMQDKPYVYGTHYLPHDVQVREFTTGKSRLDTMYQLGLKDIVVVKKSSVEDGIGETRKIINKCWFDAKKCDKGVEALKQYRAAFNEALQTYTGPIHGWESHYADAFRTFAMGVVENPLSSSRVATAIGTHDDPLRRDKRENALRYGSPWGFHTSTIDGAVWR